MGQPRYIVVANLIQHAVRDSPGVLSPVALKLIESLNKLVLRVFI